MQDGCKHVTWTIQIVRLNYPFYRKSDGFLFKWYILATNSTKKKTKERKREIQEGKICLYIHRWSFCREKHKHGSICGNQDPFCTTMHISKYQHAKKHSFHLSRGFQLHKVCSTSLSKRSSDIFGWKLMISCRSDVIRLPRKNVTIIHVALFILKKMFPMFRHYWQTKYFSSVLSCLAVSPNLWLFH